MIDTLMENQIDRGMLTRKGKRERRRTLEKAVLAAQAGAQFDQHVHWQSPPSSAEFRQRHAITHTAPPAAQVARFLKRDVALKTCIGEVRPNTAMLSDARYL